MDEGTEMRNDLSQNLFQTVLYFVRWSVLDRLLSKKMKKLILSMTVAVMALASTAMADVSYVAGMTGVV